MFIKKQRSISVMLCSQTRLIEILLCQVASSSVLDFLSKQLGYLCRPENLCLTI